MTGTIILLHSGVANEGEVLMEYIVAFLAGVLVASIVWGLILMNNVKKFNEYVSAYNRLKEAWEKKNGAH